MSCIPVACSVQMITVAFRARVTFSTVMLEISERFELPVLLTTCEAILKVNEPTCNGDGLVIPADGDAPVNPE